MPRGLPPWPPVCYDRPMTCFAIALLAAAAVVTVGCGSSPGCPPSAPAPTKPATAAPVPTTAAAALAEADAPMVEDMKKASSTLDRFHAAAAAADETAYFALFADGGVFLGTDGKERWTVPEFRAYAHPRFAAGKAWSFRSVRRDLSVRGSIAWFDEDLDTPNLGPARGSGVLVRDVGSGAGAGGSQGEWKVAQYNLSIPIPNERFADVRKIIAAPGK